MSTDTDTIASAAAYAVAEPPDLLLIGWTSLPLQPRLRQPTPIVAGDDDAIIPLINARMMHRLIPRSELHVYRGGHLELATDAGVWRQSCRRSSPPKGSDRM